MINKEQIIEVLKTCFDPEIPIDLWNLGLIYEIKLNNKTEVQITMTLTTPGCTMINMIADDVKEKLSKIKNVKNVIVNVTFDPPWSPEMMTDEGKIKLGFKPKNTTTEKKDEWE